MKTDNTSAVKVETVKDEIVVDSADVRRAQELALKRGTAREVDTEIITEASVSRSPAERKGR